MAENTSKIAEKNEFLQTGKVFVYSGLGSALKQSEESLPENYEFTTFWKDIFVKTINNIMKKPLRYDLPEDFDFTKLKILRDERVKTMFWEKPSTTAKWVQGAPKRIFFQNQEITSYLRKLQKNYEPITPSIFHSHSIYKKRVTIFSGLSDIIEMFSGEFKNAQEDAITHLDNVANRVINSYRNLKIVGAKVEGFGYFKQHIVHYDDKIGFENNESKEEGIYKGLTANGKIKIEYENKVILADSKDIFPIDENDFYPLHFTEIDETFKDEEIERALETNNLTKEELSNMINIKNMAKQNKFVEGQVLIDNLKTLYFIGDKTQTLDYYRSTPRLYTNDSFTANINGEATEVIYTGNISNEGIEVIQRKNGEDSKLQIKLNDIVLESITELGKHHDLHEANSIPYTSLKFSLEEFENMEILSNKCPGVGEVQLPYEHLEDKAA